jgi:tetratricopeptide (TPR) repeat protein
MQSGDNFRLTVNLMNTTTMASIWSKTYDKKMSASDIFSTQDEIVKSLVQELSVGGFINAAMMKDIGNRSIAKGTDNSLAYECVNFYKAVYLSTFSQENGTKALKCLKESTKKDPNYADAWSSLGQLQGLMYSWGQLDAVVLDEALPNIERAIALEPNNAMYYVTKASTLNMQKKWEPMFATLDKALEISPNNAEVVANVVVTYITGGDCTEAQRADFNAPKGTYTKGLCQWQKGFEAGLKADELDKSGSMFPPRNFPMANVYIRGGQWKNAAARLEKVNFPGFFWYELFSGLAMHGDGNKEQATKHFDTLKKSLGSSKLSEIGKQMIFWNMKGAFESWTPIFIAYGFN